MIKRIISLITLVFCLLSIMPVAVPVSANSVSVYMENDTYGEVNGNTIEMIPQGLTVKRFLDNIKGAYGAKVEKEMYDAFDNLVTDGPVVDGMKVKITYKESVKEYTLKLAPVITKSNFFDNGGSGLIYPKVNTFAEGIPISGVICVEGCVTMTAYQSLRVSFGMQDDMWTYPIRFEADGTIGQFIAGKNTVKIPYELNKPYQFVVLMDLPKKRSWFYLNGVLVSIDKQQGDPTDRLWDGKPIGNIYITKTMDYFKYYSVASVEDFDISPYSCDLASSNGNVTIDKEAGIVQINGDAIKTKKDLFDSLYFANEEEKEKVVLRNRIGAPVMRDTALLRNTMYLDVTSTNGLATLQYAITGVNDVKTNPYAQSDYDKFGFLKALGVFPENDTLSTASVSRAEFAKYLVSMTNSLEMASSCKETFSDVDAENMSAPYIYAAAAQGYMSGRGDGTFGAGDKIAYNEAVTALVRVAGYEELAQARGGYPAGYYSTALSASLLSGVKSDGSGAVNKLEIAKLLYNTLMASYNNTSLISNGYIEYTADENVTVLEQLRKLKKAKGIMTANSFTHIYEGGKKTTNGQVMIDDLTYSVPSNNDYDDYLGMKVEFYYADDGNTEGYIVYMNKLPIVEVLTLDADSLVSVSDNVLSYLDDDDHLKKASVSSSFSLLYNGRTDPNRTLNDLLIHDGELTLVDGNGTGKYDLAIARVPELFLFEGSDDMAGTIYTNGEMLETDVDSSSLKSVDRFGAVTPITISEIPYPSVLTVYRSKDKECIEVYVSATTKEDVITEQAEDFIMVGGSRLIMAPDFDSGGLNFKETYLFRLDAFGRIAFCEISRTSDRYGYLIGAAGVKGLSSRPQLRIVVGEGDYTDYTVAEKVMLNGNKENSADVIFSGAFEPQLIKYTVNKNSEIISITTNLIGETTSGRYINSGGVRAFDSRIVLNESTFNLEVPSVAEEITDYKLYSTPVFLDEQNYNIEVYDLDEESRAAGAILHRASGSLAGSLNLAMNISMGIVKKVSNALDREGNEMYVVELVGTTGTHKYYLNEDRFFDKPDLKFGDCIRYLLNSKGDTIMNFAREFRIDEDGKTYSITPNTTLTSYSHRYGMIQNKYDNYVTIDDVENGVSCILQVVAGRSFRVDFKSETITQTKIKDMLPNVTGVFSRGSSTYAPNIIVEYMFDD